MGSVALTVNGEEVTLTYSDYDTSEFLLYLLREQLPLQGPRFGCGVSECGCCTVLINGAPVRSCVTEVSTLSAGDQITTLEGIGTPQHPHPMQQAFVDLQAGQCAFCCNSMIMGAIGFINGRVAAGNRTLPTKQEIADFLSGNTTDPPLKYICRCGAHLRIMAAIEQAAGQML